MNFWALMIRAKKFFHRVRSMRKRKSLDQRQQVLSSAAEIMDFGLRDSKEINRWLYLGRLIPTELNRWWHCFRTPSCNQSLRSDIPSGNWSRNHYHVIIIPAISFAATGLSAVLDWKQMQLRCLLGHWPSIWCSCDAVWRCQSRCLINVCYLGPWLFGG